MAARLDAGKRNPRVKVKGLAELSYRSVRFLGSHQNWNAIQDRQRGITELLPCINGQARSPRSRIFNSLSKVFLFPRDSFQFSGEVDVEDGSLENLASCWRLEDFACLESARDADLRSTFVYVMLTCREWSRICPLCLRRRHARSCCVPAHRPSRPGGAPNRPNPWNQRVFDMCWSSSFILSEK